MDANTHSLGPRKPRAGQIEFERGVDLHRVTGLVARRQYGKTTIAARIALKKMMRIPGHTVVFGSVKLDLGREIVTTAGTNAANNKNVNITIQHSDVNIAANFTNIVAANLNTNSACPMFGPLTIAEVGAVYPAHTVNVALPPHVKQFVRLLVKGEANGGNANDGTVTLKILL